MKQRPKVREIAEQQGRTQAKLLQTADVNSRTMSVIWHDPYGKVTCEVLFKNACALNIEVAVSVGEESDENKQGLTNPAGFVIITLI